MSNYYTAYQTPAPASSAFQASAPATSYYATQAAQAAPSGLAAYYAPTGLARYQAPAAVSAFEQYQAPAPVSAFEQYQAPAPVQAPVSAVEQCQAPAPVVEEPVNEILVGYHDVPYAGCDWVKVIATLKMAEEENDDDGEYFCKHCKDQADGCVECRVALYKASLAEMDAEEQVDDFRDRNTLLTRLGQTLPDSWVPWHRDTQAPGLVRDCRHCSHGDMCSTYGL